jgi:hypothetical protein
MRDLIIEHDCRYKSTGKLFNNGDVVITTSDGYDPGFFEEAFGYDTGPNHSSAVPDEDLSNLQIPVDRPVSWPDYEGELEDPTTKEWVEIVFTKTFLRTAKTDEEILKWIPVLEATNRLIPQP